MHRTISALLLCAQLIGLATLAQSPKSSGFNLYSIADEKSKGLDEAKTLDEILVIAADRTLDGYFANLTAAFLKHADSLFSFTFRAYQDRKLPVVTGLKFIMPQDAFLGKATEPICVAGGFIYIPLSLLAEAPNETAFGFQVAHAMAHIALRHGTRTQSRLDVMEKSTLGLKEGLSEVQQQGKEGFPKLQRQGLEQMLKNVQRKFSRDYELEADEAAMRMMARSGFDPSFVIPYLEKLADIEEAEPFRSYHPSRRRRIEVVKKRIAGIASQEIPVKIEGFTEAKDFAAALRE